MRQSQWKIFSINHSLLLSRCIDRSVQTCAVRAIPGWSTASDEGVCRVVRQLPRCNAAMSDRINHEMWMPGLFIRHNSAYVRFRGLIVIKMTLCVMMNRTMVAHRENPRIERSSGGRLAGLFGRACRRLPVTSTCPHTLQALPDVHLGPIAAPGFDAELLVPSPRVFHIPLRYSRPRRV